jgi:hypothetical protein
VIGCCHAEEALHIVDPGIFAGLFPPDCEVIDNSVQVPLKQFIMDNPLHIPPDAQHDRPDRGGSFISKLPFLKRANHFWDVLSAIESSL